MPRQSPPDREKIPGRRAIPGALRGDRPPAPREFALSYAPLFLLLPRSFRQRMQHTLPARDAYRFQQNDDEPGYEHEGAYIRRQSSRRKTQPENAHCYHRSPDEPLKHNLLDLLPDLLLQLATREVCTAQLYIAGREHVCHKDSAYAHAKKACGYPCVGE